MSNPLLQKFDTVHDVPPFAEIKTGHFIPAIIQLINSTLKEVESVANNTDTPTFENTIEALENTGKHLGVISSILFNLNSAETSEALQAVTQEASPLLTEFDNTVRQNKALFERISHVYGMIEKFQGESKMLLEKTYKSFVRSGAGLDDKLKVRYKEISTQLATLSLKFGENILAETNAYEMLIESKDDLAGLPKDLVARANELATEKGKEGKWIFTLHAPSYIPFMEYADNRSLREKLFKAYMRKAFKGDARDTICFT